MNPAGAMRAYGLKMLARAIAYVPGEIVLRVDFVEGAHQRVAIGFSDDGSGGNRSRDGIAVDDGLLRQPDFFELDGVYQQVIGARV
jgi:hypothetical protein